MKPIFFSTPMVQVLMNGTKLQTRRIIKHNQKTCSVVEFDGRGADVGDKENIYQFVKCPYGQVGDILWVRETFRKFSIGNDIDYRADYGNDSSLLKGVK